MGRNSSPVSNGRVLKMSCPVCFVMVGIALVVVDAIAKPHALLSSPATRLNFTSLQDDFLLHNGTDSAVGSRIANIMNDLPTIKNIVIFVCLLTTLLITYLVFKLYRSGRKIRKTRKYDIITTPAERVEMAPLNEDNDDDEDATLFDVKYS